MATLLDPRFKGRYFEDDFNRRMTKQIIKESMAADFVEQTTEKEQDKGETGLWEMHGTFVGRTGEASKEEMINMELQMYLNSGISEISVDPLVFWEENSLRFPHLYKMTRRYFSAMATSVPSERLFSMASLIMTKRRNRLTSEHFSQLLFLSSIPIEDWDLNPK